MKTKVIAFTSEKGGTGKTMLATHLAAILANKWRVLLVDGDPQAHTTISFGLTKEPMLHDLLVRGLPLNQAVRQPDPKKYTMLGDVPQGQLYVVPGNQETAVVPMLTQDLDCLRDVISELEGSIDYVILDTAPTPGGLIPIMYRAIDYAIIPTKLEYLALDGMIATISTVRDFKYRQIEVLGIAPNLFKKTILHQRNLVRLKAWAADQGCRVLPEIGDRTAFGEVSQNKTMVYTAKGGDRAAAELLALTAAVKGMLAHV